MVRSSARWLAEKKLARQSYARITNNELFLYTKTTPGRRRLLRRMAAVARERARASLRTAADLARRGLKKSAHDERLRAVRLRARAARYRRMSPSRLKPYVVRGMKLRCAGSVSVRSSAGGLSVSSHCMGSSPSPATRWPVVVFLERPPKLVSVYVSMTQ
ncbi:MAG: hypothetical protein KC503_41325 [Myxococcales bacterium]|nr:hypothetical protein [Myxococcales bacterium]